MFGNDQYTRSLLHCDGANGSTSFPDVAAYPYPTPGDLVWTAAGSAQVDTSVYYFGTGSLLLNAATSDYITTPNNALFNAIGTNPFVVDLRLNLNAVGSLQAICGVADTGGNNASISFSVQVSASAKLIFSVFRGSTVISVTNTATLATGTWYHLAGIFDGTNIYAAVNGTLSSGAAVGGSVNSTANGLSIGRLGDYSGQYTSAHVDEFRFSFGTTRGWTSNFTPPNEPYDVPPNPDLWRGSDRLLSPPKRITVRGATVRKEDGTEAPFTFQRQFVPWQFQQQHPQPPSPIKFRGRMGGILPGDASDQNDQPHIELFPPIGWAVQPPPPPRFRSFPNVHAGALMRGDDGDYNKFQLRPFVEGWAVQPPQPPHPRPERAGAVMPIEPGIEYPYIYVAPTIIWSSGVQQFSPPAHRYRREAAIMRGIDGTDAPFIRFVVREVAQTESAQRRPPRRFAGFGDPGIEAPIPRPFWGWSQTAADLRRISRPWTGAFFQALTFPLLPEPAWTEDQVDLPRRRRLLAAVEIEPAFVPLPAPPRWGFDPETEALVRRRLHAPPAVDERLLPPFPPARWGWSQQTDLRAPKPRRGAFQEVEVHLPRPIGWGFAAELPTLAARPRRDLDRGFELVTSFPPVWTSGWEVQPLQPPRPGFNRAAAFMRGIDGAAAPLIVPVFDGWDPLLFWPPHPRPERGGAIMTGDLSGAWGLFYYLIPSGALATDAALYAAIAYDVGIAP